ncbi:MAG: hypothetical protein JW716_01820 [Candidatus Aenigmarchaeota archaeon]|nr:hypothetical protein [Candidatus Aenigmarchaeota archaeon]
MAINPVFRYYYRDDVREAMVKAARKREIAGVFDGGGFSSRPDMVKNPSDILEMVKKGAIEFHCSIERWTNPMSIRQDNYDDIREGWDIILDLDCKDTEHGKEAAKALKWALNEHDIENISIKFTGGTGFHMGIPWESFPKEINFEPVKSRFPQLPRAVADYLREFTRERLISNLEKRWSWEEMAKTAGIKIEDIKNKDGTINPWKIVDIDPILISPRHLFRMPYSLNMKSMLVSVPFCIDDIDKFDKEWAKPENVRTDMGFMDRHRKNEAESLFSRALELKEKRKDEEIRSGNVIDYEIEGAIQEDYFPACIHNILKGMSDGRKRAMFILTSFLRSVKWDWDVIENRLHLWNSMNTPPLPRNTIVMHIRNHRRKPDVLPPNCGKDGWYMDVGACEPDECEKYRNPATYVLKTFIEKQKKPKKRKRKIKSSYPTDMDF